METTQINGLDLVKGTPEFKAFYEKKLPDGTVVDLSKDPLIRELSSRKCCFTLVGGAVIDIINGRKPKDYDFTQIVPTVLNTLGFKYEYDTATAITYKRESDGIIIQRLKTAMDSFDFTISRSRITGESDFSKYSIRLSIDDANSYLSKLLVPQSYEPQAALNSLMRIPHWRKKGYEIHDMTYYSLLKAVASIDGFSVFKALFKNS